MNLKKMVAVAVVAATAFMPACFAESWTKTGSTQDGNVYIDMDTVWYDGTTGGFVQKLAEYNGRAFIVNNKFKDYSDGVDVLWGTGTAYDTTGNAVESHYMGTSKFYKRGTNMWRFCMIVKNHFGY